MCQHNFRDTASRSLSLKDKIRCMLAVGLSPNESLSRVANASNDLNISVWNVAKVPFLSSNRYACPPLSISEETD